MQSLYSNNYETLLVTLDQIRKEAPSEYKRYYPLDTDTQGLDGARSKALIHLYLKVKFGLLSFLDRENLITDESGDGGVDAYFIDQEASTVYYIQSKFRTSEKNFTNKNIELDEILKMDVDRFVKGYLEDENGSPYNKKILSMIQKIKNLNGLPKYSHKIIILANLSNSITNTQLKKLTGGFEVDVLNHKKMYLDLVFHAIQGTFYNPKELVVKISLSNTSMSSSRIRYKVSTKVFDCEIQVLFVPTLEIAKTLYKYRNSILKYNLRSYLELANNKVNRDIANSIIDLNTNEFALYNNGITMLSSDTVYNEQSFEQYTGQLLITHPQIINGGQTAYTLNRVYEECLIGKVDLKVFDGKEVLLKVIKLPVDLFEDEKFRELIETIANATNFQTKIEDADRRANDIVQINLQEKIFSEYGYFYERKKGEFADGVKYHYINRSQIIDRETLIRLSRCCDGEIAEARRSSRNQLFQEHLIQKTLDVSKYQRYMYAYNCWKILEAMEKGYTKDKNNKYGIAIYGNALRYGKYAVVGACLLSNSNNEDAARVLNSVLASWMKFEEYIIALPHNNDYFRSYSDPETGIRKQELNFDNYYKGKTLNNDLPKFFVIKN